MKIILGKDEVAQRAIDDLVGMGDLGSAPKGQIWDFTWITTNDGEILQLELVELLPEPVDKE